MKRIGLALATGCLLVLSGCVDEAPAAAAQQQVVKKGGDDLTGGYEAVAGFWKPAPDHNQQWGWGEVSGVAVDNPNRIIVSIWGDRSTGLPRVERPRGSNYMVVVDGNGNFVESWSQWDSLFNKAHQTYISPYDPERNVWLMEMGGAVGRMVYMSVLKFSNDGKQLKMRLFDPNHPQTRDEARANPHPAPYAYGNPAVMAHLPDGSFLVGDGYYNSRIIKYDRDGKFVWEFGELGSGPGQFDLIHGIAVGREGQIYVGDRTNNRVQVFTSEGEFIEEWPGISDPVGVFVDENESVWVISARLNRILKYSKQGELLYHFGTYAVSGGADSGAFQRPHQMDVGPDGTLYVTSWDGGWLTKFVPRPDANPDHLVGRRLLLPH
jgi:DNA-binding beta-propeller fold protein YncE